MRVGDRVKVIDAPGYADFEGVALLLPTDDWPVRKVIVGFEWEGTRDFAVVPQKCVHPADELAGE